MPPNATHQFSRHVSVPSDEGIRVDKGLIVKRPASEVYAFWRHLENLPRFMRHVESVTVQDDLHSHWAVKTLAGKVLEWDAEIIEQRENEMISWRSAPGADVDNAGSVWFTPVPGQQGTLVRVEFKYVPPGGKAGALVATIFERDAGTEIEEDLSRLKALLESDQLPPEPKPPSLRATRALRNTFNAADACVHKNAWLAITFIAGCAFAIGFLLGCRSKLFRD